MIDDLEFGIALFVMLPLTLVFFFWWIGHCDKIGIREADFRNAIKPDRIGWDPKWEEQWYNKLNV